MIICTKCVKSSKKFYIQWPKKKKTERPRIRTNCKGIEWSSLGPQEFSSLRNPSEAH